VNIGTGKPHFSKQPELNFLNALSRTDDSFLSVLLFRCIILHFIVSQCTRRHRRCCCYCSFSHFLWYIVHNVVQFVIVSKTRYRWHPHSVCIIGWRRPRWHCVCHAIHFAITLFVDFQGFSQTKSPLVWAPFVWLYAPGCLSMWFTVWRSVNNDNIWNLMRICLWMSDSGNVWLARDRERATHRQSGRERARLNDMFYSIVS
jgi:hypothetical protein